MPRNLRIPEVPISDKQFLHFVRLLGKLTEQRCGPGADFATRSAAARSLMADAMWMDEELRLQELSTDVPRLEVDGEPYRRLQPSNVVVHGMWGSHVVPEPLYRREEVRNGPTVKPLEKRLGLVSRSLLPDLASLVGALMASMTSREASAMLTRLGLRAPSRAVLDKRGGDMLEDMAVDVRSLEDSARHSETMDFEVGAVSCGLDRMAVRMDEVLPEGPEREAKLRARANRTYERQPPEPYTSQWRMAWTGNVTVYDTEGVPRRSFRYGMPADGDVEQLAARVVDDVLALVAVFPKAPVVCIQDGARDLDVLRARLRQWLPEGVRREHAVDFHHAISYLDAVVSACEPEGDLDGMGGWYRDKLLHEDRGIDDVLRHLVRRRAQHPVGSAPREAIEAAIRYCGKRRHLMRYAALRADGLPIGSGATESGCALFQLRVKHPGSHWHPPGLAGVMAGRGLSLSERWDAAFAAYHRTLLAEVHPT